MNNEKPILFSGAMVRALLAGTKTQTRRVIKLDDRHDMESAGNGAGPMRPVWYETGQLLNCPYGMPGYRLWVKETHARVLLSQFDLIAFRATAGSELVSGVKKWTPSIFMPRKLSRITLEIESIRVERVQAISEEDAIAEGIECEVRQATAIYRDYSKPDSWCICPVASYRSLWNSINLKPSPIYETDEESGKKLIVAYQSFPWSEEDFDAEYPGVRSTGRYRGQPLTVTANPWVWVITFRKL